MDPRTMLLQWLNYLLLGAALGWVGVWLYHRLYRAARLRELRRGHFIFVAPYQPSDPAATPGDDQTTA
jgi:hypothetical protein